MYNITNELIEISKSGKGISTDLFRYLLGDMTERADETVSDYENFFDDIVKGSEQYVDFERIGDEETEKHRWFETTYASLCKIREVYGDEICKTIAESVTDNTFLYPYEMNKAAEYLKNGGHAEDFGDMIQEGILVDDTWGFPKISDLAEANETLIQNEVEDDEEFEM